MNQRKIKRTQLFKLQELQRKAFDKGINMEITPRDTNTDSPWIVGYVNKEGRFAEGTEGKDYIHYSFYDWRDFWTEEENLAVYEEEFNKIEKFINK